MTIHIEETSTGNLILIKALPGVRRNGITGEHAGALKVAVTQAPEKGKANAAIVEVLAHDLGLKRNQIELVSGSTSALKKFRVTGVPRQELEQRIRRALGPEAHPLKSDGAGVIEPTCSTPAAPEVATPNHPTPPTFP